MSSALVGSSERGDVNHLNCFMVGVEGGLAGLDEGGDHKCSALL